MLLASSKKRKPPVYAPRQDASGADAYELKDLPMP